MLASTILALASQASGQQLAELDGVTGSNAGSQAILSSRGAALGAPTANNGQGEVDLYQVPSGGWNGPQSPTLTMTASDGTQGDGFGSALATAGAELMVGAPNHQGGAIYVYNVGKGPTLLQELPWTGSGVGALGTSLGTSLSAPSYMVAGAPGQNVVILYQQEEGEWQNVANAGNPLNDGEVVGGVVAMAYGRMSIYGGPFVATNTNQGKVIVMEGVNSVLEAIVALKGQAGDFGAALSMQESSSYLFVGEPSTGTVYVYFAPSAEGTPVWNKAKLIAMLTDSNLGNRSLLGSSISFSGKSMLVGAPGAGVVDEFTEPIGGWVNASVPTASYSGPGAGFGQTVAWEIAKTPAQFVVGSPSIATGFVEGVQ